MSRGAGRILLALLCVIGAAQLSGPVYAEAPAPASGAAVNSFALTLSVDSAVTTADPIMLTAGLELRSESSRAFDPGGSYPQVALKREGGEWSEIEPLSSVFGISLLGGLCERDKPPGGTAFDLRDLAGPLPPGRYVAQLFYPYYGYVVRDALNGPPRGDLRAAEIRSNEARFEIRKAEISALPPVESAPQDVTLTVVTGGPDELSKDEWSPLWIRNLILENRGTVPVQFFSYGLGGASLPQAVTQLERWSATRGWERHTWNECGTGAQASALAPSHKLELFPPFAYEGAGIRQRDDGILRVALDYVSGDGAPAPRKRVVSNAVIFTGNFQKRREMLRAEEGKGPLLRRYEPAELAQPARLGRGLQHAARLAHAAAVGRLLAEGADVDFADSAGATALHRAAEGDDLALVRVLLAAGADPNRRDNEGLTPLLVGLSKRGFQKTSGAAETLSVSEALLSAGADARARDIQGNSCLHLLATRYGHTEPALASLLISKGADPNAQRQDGWTPLRLAERNAKRWLVELLKQAGATH